MDDRERKIRDEAYRIWVEAGRPEGEDARHWEEAERRLSSIDGQGAKPAAKTKTVAKNAGNGGVEAPAASLTPRKGDAVEVKRSKTAATPPPTPKGAPGTAPAAKPSRPRSSKPAP